ncbi:MAG TPA: alpha/beta hydrolase [Dinghuibacter sp.]|uniref:alpha/beta hydrolase n=1 Tax=Dinghuibacter sp. TaxID=2024697 RepID=UPI002BF0CDC5|nr:alpha/beta hydrolase [Dinghuibacter sp.]HTJ12636.1 alpha/beta hydrolase [Dinghuibacter sp.]
MKITLFVSLIWLAQALHAQQIYKDVPYKDTLKLDLYEPAGTSPRPVVIIIHGGAWVRGDKSLDEGYYLPRLRDQLLLNGYAVASIDYTLLSATAHFPTPIEDGDDAVRWLKTNATQYRLDTTHFGLWGASAGGHLALLCGYKGKFDYIIDNFGPTDLNMLFKTHASPITTLIFKTFLRKIYDIRNQLIIAFTNLDIRQKRDRPEIRRTLAGWSVLNQSGLHYVPTLILHGTHDKVVPLKQSRKLHKQLDEASADNEFIEVPNGDHGFNNVDHPGIDTIVARTIVYIKAHTKY